MQATRRMGSTGDCRNRGGRGDDGRCDRHEGDGLDHSDAASPILLATRTTRSSRLGRESSRRSATGQVVARGRVESVRSRTVAPHDSALSASFRTSTSGAHVRFRSGAGAGERGGEGGQAPGTASKSTTTTSNAPAPITFTATRPSCARGGRTTSMRDTSTLRPPPPGRAGCPRDSIHAHQLSSPRACPARTAARARLVGPPGREAPRAPPPREARHHRATARPGRARRVRGPPLVYARIPRLNRCGTARRSRGECFARELRRRVRQTSLLSLVLALNKLAA